MARTVALLASMLFLSLMAGCLSGGTGQLDPFDALAVPVWAPGHEWDWEATSGGTWSYEGEDGRGSTSGSETAMISHRVFNSAQPLFGEPVYWVESENGIDDLAFDDESAFGRDGIHALGQDDLQPVGRVFDHGFSFAECRSTSFEAYSVDPFPLLRFPLENGMRWQQDVEEHVRLRAEVLGAESVQVPAGTFDAVRVHIEVEISPEAFDGLDAEGFSSEPLVSYRGATDVWYAAAAENVVRLKSQVEMVFEEGGERVELSLENDLRLVSFALDTAPQDPLPGAVLETSPPVADPYEQPALDDWTIVTNATLPLNSATMSTQVRLAVADLPVDMPHDHTPNHVFPVDEVVPLQDVGEGVEFEWTIHRGGEVWKQAKGLVVDVLLEPGSYELQVLRLVAPAEAPAAPATCDMEMAKSPPVHASWMAGVRSATFAVEWERPFEVTHDATLAEPHEVFQVPIAAGAELMATYDVTVEPPGRDDGHLVVTFADGSTVDLYSHAGYVVTPEQVGGAMVEWSPEGAFGTPITTGHTVTGSLHVRYG